MTEAYLTTKDLETKFKMSRATIKKLRDEGLPSYTLAGTIRFKENEVEQWVKEQNKQEKQKKQDKQGKQDKQDKQEKKEK